MKYLLAFMFLIGSFTYASGQDGYPDEEYIQEYVPEEEPKKTQVATDTLDNIVNIVVVGQGVAPSFASSPAQSYALAKRAAMADAYRLLAEQVKGVRIEGKDTIKNMAIKSSVVNTRVQAMIKNAKVLETTYKNGMCEVEMEVNIDKNHF
ncbi:MAG: LPP20 family lipoprotein [Campylobacterota bacterium]|nr:LPP20 family lipoprotein [Campylobacterota bacterium]